jgi:hypothetical protein
MNCVECNTAGNLTGFRFMTGKRLSSHSTSTSEPTTGLYSGTKTTTTTTSTYSDFAPLEVFFCESCINHALLRQRGKHLLYAVLALGVSVFAVLQIPIVLLFSIPVSIVWIYESVKRYKFDDQFVLDNLDTTLRNKGGVGTRAIWTPGVYKALFPNQ